MTATPSAFTILDALRDRVLFGGHPTFADLATWRPWLAFLAAVYGLPLDAAGAALFRTHTGRSSYAPPPGGWREVVCITGRQSGKSRVASLLAVFEAALTPKPADRTALYAVLVAQDHRAALRTLFEYATSLVEDVPILARAVRSKKSETIALDSGVTLAAYPCRPEAVRGLRARVVVCDELAFFRTSDYRPVDREMLRAVRPTLATTGGRLIILSSPYGQSGALWELHKRHFGRAGAPVLVWQAAAPAMNPTLPADYLERMREEDPEAYRSEVLGEFRTGVSTLFEPEAIDAVVMSGRRELAPVAGTVYRAFVDPSGGSKDAFTLSVAHRDGERVIVDLVRAWRPPFNPSGVVSEAADLVKSYRVPKVVGDRYAGEWPREAFRSQGITYDVSDLDRSALYVELLPVVNAARIELLDVPELLRELRGLERRRGTSGRDRVDHVPGAHDDMANAVAGAVHLVAGAPVSKIGSSSIVFLNGPRRDRELEAASYRDPRGE